MNIDDTFIKMMVNLSAKLAFSYNSLIQTIFDFQNFTSILCDNIVELCKTLDLDILTMVSYSSKVSTS